MGAWLGGEGGDCRTAGGAEPRVGLPSHSFNKQMFTEHLLCAKLGAGIQLEWDKDPLHVELQSWGKQAMEVDGEDRDNAQEI